MEWQDGALTMAGLIGSGTAVVHGILVQRLMVRPFEAPGAAGLKMSAPIRRLVPLLLHFSTIAWSLGGLALVAAANGSDSGVRLETALFVGSLYLFGAAANFWATRGRHPGWMLMAAALVLIAVGIA